MPVTGFCYFYVLYLHWQHEINAAIRGGKFELVTYYDHDPSTWELYDLRADLSESGELSQRHPKKLTKYSR